MQIRRLLPLVLALLALAVAVPIAYAAAVKSTVAVKVSIVETGTADLGAPISTWAWPPPTYQVQEFATGTSDSQMDRVWSDQRTVTAAADDLDVRGGLTSQLDGSSVVFTDLCLIGIHNTDTTDTLSVGADANAIATLWGATGDIIKIPPGGMFLWAAPDDCIATTAGTGDILQIDPGANTVTYNIILAGRSS
jgi:hypothetical protein